MHRDLVCSSILVALIVFAVEYEWAKTPSALPYGHARVRQADKAAASRVATASAILFGVGAIGLGGVLIFTDVLPLSSVWTGASVALGGLTVLVTTAYGVRELGRADKVDEIESVMLNTLELKGSMDH